MTTPATWWASLSRRARLVTLWTGAFTGVMSAAFALAHGITATEAYHPATRGYVREEIGKAAILTTRENETLRHSQIDAQIETVEVRRSLVDKEIFELEMTLRNVAMADQVRATLELRKRALDEDRKTLDFRLDQLQRTRSGRRP